MQAAALTESLYAWSMGYARMSLVCLNDTPYYHVIARCVRRAWLCGVDQYAGKDYSHRKAWVLERLQRLSGVFAIDVCAYAIMSNHYHLVLHVDRARAVALTAPEIVERWRQVFGVPDCVEHWCQGTATEAQSIAAVACIEVWRAHLSDISWYMRCLNEYLARRANAEDEVTGRFWEGRFKSQALLDEAGLLTAMAYVDLNPVRAGIASTPEGSEFTSIYQRVREMGALPFDTAATTGRAEGARVDLQPFADLATGNAAIPFSQLDYLHLLDWSGRAVRNGKSGAIDQHAPPILARLNIDAQAWDIAMRPKGNVFGRALGRLDHMRLHAKALGQAWVKGLYQAQRLYGTM